jgi:FkbM family methyltransferase
MNFFDYAKDIISEYLKKRDTMPSILKKIESSAAKGKIAFYPCSRYSNIILNEIKNRMPELLPRIKGCFDKSEEAITESGVDVYNVAQLEKFKKEISLLVICSNTFFARELRDLKKFTSYNGPFLKTSYFDISLKDNISVEKALIGIDKIYNLLADKKSKETYLITWLSRALNDEDLTYLFESEKEIVNEDSSIKYGNYTIDGLDAVCTRELQAELYKMRYVYPETGDVVLDIGAYKGDTAIFFANYIGDEGRVYAFEPAKSNYAVMARNIKKNNLEKIIIPINKGCSDKSGILKAVSIKSGAPWSFLSEDKGNEKVDVISIDDFIETNKIKKLDFIKVDVEGMECDVLAGARSVIKQMQPKMAIPLYHNTDDLIGIPLLINEMGDYEFYVRCKMEGPFGVTLFCRKKAKDKKR